MCMHGTLMHSMCVALMSPLPACMLCSCPQPRMNIRNTLQGRHIARAGERADLRWMLVRAMSVQAAGWRLPPDLQGGRA